MAQKSTASITYMDYDGETSAISFLIPTLSDAPASDDLADTSGELRALRDAINAITLGRWIKNQINSIDFEIATPADDKNAQRENKWLVTYMDNESSFGTPPIPNPGYGRKFTMEIPCADLSVLPDGGGPAARFLDIETDPSPGRTLKLAIEDLVLAASGGNVLVLSIEHVGRNI